MVALCHLFTFTGTILIWTILCYAPSHAQVGLRTLPLTANKNKTSLGIFSKWTGPKLGQLSSPSIENELAAIFRNVAYGAQPESTTTITSTTTTTTTTQPFITKKQFDYFDKPSSVPASFPTFTTDEEGARPVQDHHVDSPYDIPDSSGDASNDIHSDVGISKAPWIGSLGGLWNIHVYTVAALFTLLALCSLYILARLYVTSHLIPRGYYITIYLLIFLSAFFRCVFFFHDPYAVEQRLPLGLSNFLFNTPIPCIITALAVLILALLKAAHLRILPLNLQTPLAIGIISAIIICASIIVDVLKSFILNQQLASGLWAGVQALTAGWGAAICLGYMVIYYKLEKASKIQHGEAVRLSLTRVPLEGSLSRKFPKATLTYSARGTLIAAITGLTLAVLQVYGLMNIEEILIIPPQDPWAWLAFHTGCRILEFIMWSSISFSSALPTGFSKRTKQPQTESGHLLTVFSCNACASCSNLSTCCTSTDKHPSDDLYSTICESSHVVRKPFNERKGPIPHDTIVAAKPYLSHISTTLAHDRSRPVMGNSATLYADAPNVHPYWTNNFHTTSTSRPSSLILSENGAMKFRTVDPHKDSMHIIDCKIRRPQLLRNPCDNNEINAFGNSSEESNYVNGNCFTPADDHLRAFNFDKFSQGSPNKESPEIYAEVIQNQLCNDDLPIFTKYNEAPAIHSTFKGNNSSHTHDGYEVPHYYYTNQNASRAPHMYSSSQPIDKDLNITGDSPVRDFYNSRKIQQQATNPSHRGATSASSDRHKFSHQEQKTTGPKPSHYFCSESDLCSNDCMYNCPEDLSTSKSTHFQSHQVNSFYSPHCTQNKLVPNMRNNSSSFKPNDETECGTFDLTQRATSPPSGFFQNIVPSTFNNGGYSPLSSEDSHLINDNPSRIEPQSPKNRPRIKHSPTTPSPIENFNEVPSTQEPCKYKYGTKNTSKLERENSYSSHSSDEAVGLLDDRPNLKSEVSDGLVEAEVESSNDSSLPYSDFTNSSSCK